MGFNWAEAKGVAPSIDVGGVRLHLNQCVLVAFFLEQRDEVSACALNVLAQKLDRFLGIALLTQLEQLAVVDFGFFFPPVSNSCKRM